VVGPREENMRSKEGERAESRQRKREARKPKGGERGMGKQIQKGKRRIY